MKQTDSNLVAELPLISCICVTNRRIALLTKAINCFKMQDYPKKELIISYPASDRLTRHIVNMEKDKCESDIISVERPDEATLGNARNAAVAVGKGDFICTWDDDDWYHMSRLSTQLNTIKSSGSNCNSNIITRVLFYDRITGKAYTSFPYTWENTLMCKKEIFLHSEYTSKNIGEDSNVVDQLDANNTLSHIINAPFLYIYTYHRGNVWNYAHFKSFFKRSEPLDKEIAADIAKLLS